MAHRSHMHFTTMAANDDDLLNPDISDAALEAAARAVPGGALSFPNAPTVSILVVCCSNDSGEGR